MDSVGRAGTGVELRIIDPSTFEPLTTNSVGLEEVPVAAVQLRPDAGDVSADTLKEFARARLLAYQVPVDIRVVAVLPRNASMKVSTPDIRAMFSGSILHA
jgi:acyl-coenzyme A synthetase/AMP-(fatty) acid ligase